VPNDRCIVFRIRCCKWRHLRSFCYPSAGSATSFLKIHRKTIEDMIKSQRCGNGLAHRAPLAGCVRLWISSGQDPWQHKRAREARRQRAARSRPALHEPGRSFAWQRSGRAGLICLSELQIARILAEIYRLQLEGIERTIQSAACLMKAALVGVLHRMNLADL